MSSPPPTTQRQETVGLTTFTSLTLVYSQLAEVKVNSGAAGNERGMTVTEHHLQQHLPLTHSQIYATFPLVAPVTLIIGCGRTYGTRQERSV